MRQDLSRPRLGLLQEEKEETYFTDYQVVQEDNTDILNFGMVGSIFKRRLYLFLIIATIVATIGVAMTLAAPKQFVAASEVMLENRTESGPDVIRDGQAVQMLTEAEIISELRVLQSDKLATQVLNELDLRNRPEFNTLLSPPPPGPLQSIKELIKGKPEPITEEEKINNFLIKTLKSGLNVYRVDETHSIEIAYTHTDADVTSKIANSYAKAFVQDQLTRKQVSSQGDANFLGDKIEDLHQQAQADMKRVQEYRTENQLLTTSGITLTEQNIARISNQLTDARAQESEDRARLLTAQNQLQRSSNQQDVSDVLDSELIQKLRAVRADLTVQVSELSTRYGPRHPDLQSANKEITNIDYQIRQEIRRIIIRLEGNYNISKERVSSLSASLETLKAELGRSSRASVVLEDLQRRAQASQDLYEEFLNGYKSTVAREGIEKPDARILNLAPVPDKASKPNIPMNIVFVLFFAFILATIICFILEMNFSALTTTKDIETKFGLPSVGIVPLYNTVSPHGSDVIDTLRNYPSSPLQVGVSGIITSIDFMFPSKPKVLYVSSAVANEGKSTLSAALGMMSGLRGARTLIIDCDRVQRGLTRSLKRDEEAGCIIDVISGRIPLSEAIVRTSEMCDVLPISRNELPMRGETFFDGFSKLLEEVRDNYDRIILDGPPLLYFSESREMARLADFTVLSCYWRKTPISIIKQALKLLPASSLQTTGVVLTRVNAKAMARFGTEDSMAWKKGYRDYYATAY